MYEDLWAEGCILVTAPSRGSHTPVHRHCIQPHPWSVADVWWFRRCLDTDHTLHHPLLMGWEVVTATCEEEESGLADSETEYVWNIQ